MKKLLLLLILFVSFSASAQRFPSVDSLKTYILRYVKNSATESFTNLRMQNVVYGLAEFFNTNGIDTIWKSGDTLKYRKNGVNRTVGVFGGGGGSYTAGAGIKIDGSVIRWADTLFPSQFLYVNNSLFIQSTLTDRYTSFYLNKGVNDLGFESDYDGLGAGSGFYANNKTAFIKATDSLRLISDLYDYDQPYSFVGDTTRFKPLGIASNGTIAKLNSWPSGGGGSMVYPGAGIPVSTGSAWGTSITDNSANWNTAYTNRITSLTTTGTSGAATLSGNTLNIPQYSGGGSINLADSLTRIYGTLYNKNTWSDLTDFTNNGATASVVSNKIQITSGAGTFTQSLDVTQYTNLEKWKMTAKVLVGSKNGTSYGFGLGIRSANSYGYSNTLGRFNMSTLGTSGEIILNTGTTNTQVSVSGTGVSFSATDYILFTVERNVDSLIVTAFNYTTKSAIIRTSYLWDLPNTPYIHNTGRFAVYSLGGSFTIDSLVIESKEIKNAPLMVIGDSKVQGYNTSEFNKRFSYLIGKVYTPTVISGGGYDRIQDVYNRLDEIVALSPKNVILIIGSNDIRSTVDSNTYKTQYDSIENRLRTAGINVWHTDLIYETTISQSVLRGHITRIYSSDSIIYLYNNGANWPSFLDADNIHPTDAGNIQIADWIIGSGKIKAGNKIFDYISPPIAAGSNTQIQYNNSGILGASSNFTFNNSSNILALNSTSTTDQIQVTQTGSSNNRMGILFQQSGSNAVAAFGRNNTGFSGYGPSVAGDGVVYNNGPLVIMTESAGAIKFAIGTASTGGGNEEMRLTDGGYLGIGTTTPHSNLHTKSFATAYTVTSTGITLDATHHTVEATSGTFTMTLPTAVGITGREYWITNSGSGVITISTTSSQTFANVVATPTTLTVNQFASFVVKSNGSNWIAR